MYSKLAKFFLKIYVIIIILSVTVFYEPIGKSLGETIFLKDNQHFKFGSTSFDGAILYEGRTNIYIYRQELEQTVKLPINDVKNITIK